MEVNGYFVFVLVFECVILYLRTEGNSISIVLCVQTYFEIDNKVDFDFDF